MQERLQRIERTLAVGESLKIQGSTYNKNRNLYNYASLKNRPLYKARALFANMCTGLL